MAGESSVLPLSQTDLISDHLWLHTAVIAVSPDEEGNWSVLSRDGSAQEHTEGFDGVIDCTGNGSALPETSPSESYYILGSKTRAAGTEFHFADGLIQIRETFAILGDRATLDLYSGAGRLLRPR